MEQVVGVLVLLVIVAVVGWKVFKKAKPEKADDIEYKVKGKIDDIKAKIDEKF